MPTTLKDKWIVTRKPHQCLFCGRTFPVKTRMRYWVGIFESDFNSNYSCSTCNTIIDTLPREEDGYCEGYVSEMLDNGQTPEDFLDKMKKKTINKEL